MSPCGQRASSPPRCYPAAAWLNNGGGEGGNRPPSLTAFFQLLFLKLMLSARLPPPGTARARALRRQKKRYTEPNFSCSMPAGIGEGSPD